MIINSKYKVQRQFDRAYQTYNQHNQIQNQIGEILINKISNMQQQYNNIIDIGCGTGVLTQKIEEKLPCKSIIALDISKQLLTCLTEINTTSITMPIQADYHNMPIKSASCNLAFSNMALHWSIDLNKTLTEINRILTDESILACSIPINGTFSDLQSSIKNYSNNDNGFKFISEYQLKEMLAFRGFEIIQFEVINFNLHFNSIINLIKSFKNVGASVLYNHAYNRNLSGKKLINQLMLNYPTVLRENTHYYALNYLIAFLIAKKNRVI